MTTETFLEKARKLADTSKLSELEYGRECRQINNLATMVGGFRILGW